MKLELLDLLICPACKAKLVLTATKQDGDEVIEGTLTCESNDHTYPIEDTIPNLLPPELRDTTS